MPETFRDFAVVEVAILVTDHLSLPSGHERAVEGDIIAIRKPRRVMGTKTRSRYLWLLLEGLDWNPMSILDRSNIEPIPLDDIPNPDEIPYDKRRYCIPLDRLKVVAPFLDLARVRDVADKYQPFLNVDEDTGDHLPSSRTPFSVHGLVYDKAFQRFL